MTQRKTGNIKGGIFFPKHGERQGTYPSLLMFPVFLSVFGYVLLYLGVFGKYIRKSKIRE